MRLRPVKRLEIDVIRPVCRSTVEALSRAKSFPPLFRALSTYMAT